MGTTISPSFPSMIPFWIKVQGVPIHLWTEGTARSIGSDIGTFETAENTSESMRMRVHVNGRLPLIKSSVLEFDNGDEISATLVYERLEKHCSQCGRLDHELRDCLEAKAQKKALLATQENSQGGKTQAEPQLSRRTPALNHSSGTEGNTEHHRHGDKVTPRYLPQGPLHDAPRGRNTQHIPPRRDRQSQRLEWL